MVEVLDKICATNINCEEKQSQKKNPEKFRIFREGGRWDSNPRPLEPQSNALTD